MEITMRFAEFSTIKPKPPKTPEQARVDALAQGVDHARDALAAERTRQKKNKAQQQLQKAVAPLPT
jgi:hypothetical protein